MSNNNNNNESIDKSFKLFDDKKMAKVMVSGIYDKSMIDKMIDLKLVSNNGVINHNNSESSKTSNNSSSTSHSTQKIVKPFVWRKPYSKHNFKIKSNQKNETNNDSNNGPKSDHNLKTDINNNTSNDIIHRLRTPTTTSPYGNQLRKPKIIDQN
jgi:hypothetical protein